MAIRLTGVQAPAEGTLTAVDVDGTKVAVTQVQGALYAFQDECTHMQCSLSSGEIEGRTVVCPCHFGRFDVTTGAVVDGPPPTPLRTWSVRTVDDGLELEA